MFIDTTKLDKESKRKYWHDVINNFELSGIKLKDYCTQNGIKYDHMAYYLQQHRKNNQKQQTSTTDFIPVQLDTFMNSQYVIKIDNNIEVKIPASSGINQVAALISEIRKTSC